MAITRGKSPSHSTDTTNVADLLERILDKGVVIAGDIKLKLLDIELLTIQLRLVVCSIEKAQEMGLDWWVNQPVGAIEAKAKAEADAAAAELEAKSLPANSTAQVQSLEARVRELEAMIEQQNQNQQPNPPIIQQPPKTHGDL